MQLSLSSNNFYWISPQAAIELFAKTGYEKIDLGMTGRGAISDPEGLFAKLDLYAQAAKACGVQFGQAHGPYSPAMDKESNPEVVFQAQLLALQGAERIGIPYLVVHPCVYSWCMGKNGREEAAAKNMEWFSRFVPFLQKSKVILCIENCYIDDFDAGVVRDTFGCAPEELIELVDTLNAKAGKTAFGVCLDVGHCHCSGGDVVEMARKLGNRILALHVHDNDGTDDHHMPPFTTDQGIDWEGLMGALAEVGYAGTLNFELDTLVMRKSPELLESGMALLYDIGLHLRALFLREKKGV